MLNTVGTVIVVLVIATVCIAWAHTPAHKALTSPVSISPYELQRSAPPLPAQDLDDRTFVFGNGF